MRTLGLILLAVVLGVVGQLLLKQGVSADGPIGGINRALLATIFRPLVLLGFACYGLSSLFWLVVLSRTELSFAYPMIALGYVLVFFLSWWFFHDKVTWVRLVGLALICGGVVVVALSKPPTTQ
jgi:multidrug transporter EmrE-like cation transporter